MTDHFSDYERGVITNVEKHGWHANHVFDPEDGPAFTYSVGFPQTLGCADCVIVGLPNDVMHGILWSVFHQIRKGKTLEIGARWDELLEGDYTCISIPIRPEVMKTDYRLSSSKWYQRKVMKSVAPFEAFQIVWPSAQGNLFPWDHGCPNGFAEAQPILGEPLSR